jgi:hypothetical protein
MKKAYWMLLALVLAAAMGLSLVGRRAPDAPQAPRVEVARETTNVALAVEDGAMVPARTAVPKGNDVHLKVVNREPHDVRIELAGYGDRVSFVLEQGATWEGAFQADRPGEDFMWLVDGLPAGRFDVVGSHLVEGHR